MHEDLERALSAFLADREQTKATPKRLRYLIEQAYAALHPESERDVGDMIPLYRPQL